MKGTADLIFAASRPERIFRALVPEMESELPRTKASLSSDQSSIRLRIEGEDIVSIRAALNTWIRLIKIAFEMESI